MGYGAAISAEPGLRAVGGTGCIAGGGGRVGGAGLLAFPSFSKFEVEGPGALRALQWLTDNQMDKPAGSVTYTQMLNRRGGIECDLTVTRLGEERVFIITGSAFGTHDLDWIRRHLPADGSAVAREGTTELGCIGLWGPLARAVLQPVTSH